MLKLNEIIEALPPKKITKKIANAIGQNDYLKFQKFSKLQIFEKS